MTARKPPRRQRKPSYRTVVGYRLACVLRAGRCEPASLWQQGREQPLIGDDDYSGESAKQAHVRLGPGIAASACRICPRSAENGSRSTAGLPITTSAARAGATSRTAR